MSRWPQGLDRILSRIEVDAETGCWDWLGLRSHDGYARLNDAYAHRIAYESFVGDVPDDLEVDHLCNVRHCVNPEHLEPVQRAENARRRSERQTHCRRGGHAFTVENTALSAGRRSCRACAAECAKRRRAAK